MDTLRAAIERWMGVEPAQAGEGTAWRIEHSFPWPPWLLLLFAIAAVAFVVYLYRREGQIASVAFKMFLAALRLTLIALTLLMLSEAMLSIDRTGLPYAAVLVDQSGSMTIADRYAAEELQNQANAILAGAPGTEATRWNLAKALLLGRQGAMLKQLQRGHKLRLYLVAGSAQLNQEFVEPKEIDEALPVLNQLKAQGPESRSRLGAALRQVLDDLRGAPPSSIVYLTDGITTDGESLIEAARVARTRGVPLFFVALGDPEPVRDLELYDLLVDDVALRGDLLTFQAKLRATGYDGKQVEIRLRTAESSTPLQSQTITLGAGPAPVRISHPVEEAGEFEFILEVDPQPQELQTANNALRRRISIRDQRIKVLLADAYPRYEFRYLKHLLERDPTVDLDTVLQEADPDYVAQDASAIALFPTGADELYAYDVVIFGDMNPSFLGPTQIANLADFVRTKGGGLAVIAGPLYTPLQYVGTPLEVVLPVELSGAGLLPDSALSQSFQPVLTAEGRVSPMFHFGANQQESLEIWEHLPGFFWLFESPAVKPGAIVLASHPTRRGSAEPVPVFVWQFAGSGKVLFHATDDVWRWRYRVGDTYLNHFWVQTVRFLARSKLVGKDVKAELTSYRLGENWGDPVQLRVRFFDQAQTPSGDNAVEVTVEHLGPGVEPRTVALRRLATDRNVFEGLLTKPAEGSYHARLSSPVLPGQAPAADFSVSAPPGELQKAQTDADALRSAAEISGGKYYTLLDGARLTDDVPAGQRIQLDTDQSIPLWNSWVVLGLFLAVLLSEWLLRKRKRML